jgi:hypothetical protein
MQSEPWDFFFFSLRFFDDYKVQLRLRTTDLAKLLKEQMEKLRPREVKCILIVTWPARLVIDVGCLTAYQACC